MDNVSFPRGTMRRGPTTYTVYRPKPTPRQRRSKVKRLLWDIGAVLGILFTVAVFGLVAYGLGGGQ